MLKIIFLLLAVSYTVQCEHVTKTNDQSRDVTKNFEYYATKWLYSSDVEYFWAKIKANGSNEIELKDSNALNREIPLQKTVSLSFDFPFYGQPIRTLAVTANGLINMHPQQQTERPWRFIAPLMACCQGFDLKNNEIDSSVRWEDTGRTFNVQWENMVSSSFHRKDIFSFQLTLKSDGTILFFYKNVSADMATINILRGGDIRIGISNYHFDPHTRKFDKWHDVIDFTDFDKNQFESSLAIVIWPRQSRSYCFQKKSCTDCTLFSQCVWCSAIKECFMPIDSIWLEKSKFCHANIRSNPNQCPVEISTVSALNLLTDNSTKASVEPNKNDTSFILLNVSFSACQRWLDMDIDIKKKLTTIANVKEAKHRNHYQSISYVDEEIAGKLWHNGNTWIELKPNKMTEHRQLEFQFPFNGKLSSDVYVLTDGYLTIGMKSSDDVRHDNFVVPFMYQFSRKPGGWRISICSTASYFAVKYENMEFPDSANVTGKMSFQVTIYPNGNIAFVYKQVPDDSFFEGKHSYFVGTLASEYNYHPLFDGLYIFQNIKLTNFYQIRNSTMIFLRPIAKCQSFTDCYSCVANGDNKLRDHPCKWCFETQRCSDGLDSNVIEWDIYICQHQAVSTPEQCDRPDRPWYTKFSDLKGFY
ncbi:Hypothetical predicted protein [Cloeon dipterum]|uniref:PSI domain-containing protein n=1 Tax=Cloeon dipterum TaxID=197152 RepID=A0A8S1DUA8_9INSE|nr:Hypothetical predicted protein [Cloeon dipterum]